MHRKSSFRFLTIAAALALLAAPHIAHADAKRDVQAKTSTFYRWYIGQINRSRDPFANRAMMRRNVSLRLRKWINSPAYREYGADYFIDAQDFDKSWSAVRTSSFRLSGSTATLTAILGKDKPRGVGMSAQKLQLKFVREGGTWKIDRVNNH